MNWLVYHIVSGQSFFSGCILLTVAAFASMRSQSIHKRITVMSFIIGIIAVAVSSTPIPFGYYTVSSALTLVWLASRFNPKWQRWSPHAFVAVWLTAVIVELPHHRTPTLQPVTSRDVTIIGDSVTAGVDGDEKSETWPGILARKHQLRIQDISHIGETAASALKRIQTHRIDAAVVVIEIGGNDILGSTTASQFHDDLDALLSQLVSANRQIVMFELPLPPFYHEFGRIQRQAAKKHNVILIPKRLFLSVIAGSDSTLDTIHLSQSGHEQMADCVWQVLSSGISDKGISDEY